MVNRERLRSDDPWAESDDLSHKKVESILSHLNQPTYITLLFTIIFYIITSTYFVNYFDRLALPFHTLNLPLTFYLNAGQNILKALVYIVLNIILVLTIIYIVYIQFYLEYKAQKIFYRINIDNYSSISIDSFMENIF
jgi:hypothetical protein